MSAPTDEVAALHARVRGLLGHPTPDALLTTHPLETQVPRALIEDSVLEPVDKVVWMVLAARARAPVSLFPAYASVARRANVRSPATVARAIAILRATRWLLVLTRQRQDPIHVLCGVPLDLPTTVGVDPGYRAFLEQAQSHHHGRVRAVAGGVQPNLDSLALNEQRDWRTLKIDSDRSGDFALTASNPAGHRVDLMDRVHPHPNASGSRQLVYPKRLHPGQRDLADRYLALVAPGVRQALLDELDGRLRAEQQGARSVYDPIRFLRRLCQASQDDGFEPNLGIAIRDAREKQIQTRQAHLPRRAEPSDPEVSQRAAERAFDTLRATLGRKPPSE